MNARLMQINLAPNPQNATTLTVTPDTGLYALVTLDGDSPGTYSVLIVPESGWDEESVKIAALNWFGLTELIP